MESIERMEKTGRGNVATLAALLDALDARIADQPSGLKLPEWLKALRRARGLSLEAAGVLSGISKPAVSRLEAGQGQVASVACLLRIYGIPLRLKGGLVIGLPSVSKSAVSFQVIEGDCRDVMRELIRQGRKVDAIVTDPPYGLGILGAKWDKTGIQFEPETWRLACELLKPGAFLLAFGHVRLVHRLTLAIEDAGLEIRDKLAWIYGGGAPFGSKDLAKAIDHHLGATREITGTVAKAGVRSSNGSKRLGVATGYVAPAFSGERRDKPATSEAAKWQGWWTGLKPAREDIVVAQKPVSEATYAANLLRWGVGGLNIDPCRVRKGALPMANRSSGLLAYQLRNARAGFRKRVPYEGQDGSNREPSSLGRYPSNVVVGELTERWTNYFYSAKPKQAARHGHECAKPVDLLRYLCRLVVPPGGIVLDMFAGSGAVGEAALQEGFNYVGVELDAVHAMAARGRLTAISENQKRAA